MSKQSAQLAVRELTTDEALEIESDRRRRVVAAFVLGAEARPDRPSLRPWRGFLGGVGLALAIALRMQSIEQSLQLGIAQSTRHRRLRFVGSTYVPLADPPRVRRGRFVSTR